MKVETELFRDPAVPKGAINVNVEHGVVVLRGEVNDESLKHRLEELAGKVEGVDGVRNLLHLPAEPAPTRR
jgi:osmotically-inducible protein OsmY